MRTCIMCRKPKNDDQFNDEHVIPDAVGGFYHIYSVCTACNSTIGWRVDNKLTNHKFIEFQRFLSGLKGQSGSVPNPFAGTHTLKGDPEQKVILKLDKDGVLKPHLVTRVVKNEAIPSEFRIIVDKENEGQIETIINKFLKRSGLTREQIAYTATESSERPMIQASLTIDIYGFKLGLLKIAYEFTADQLPQYLDDPASERIAELLLTGDADALNQQVTMLGNGFQQELMKPFEWFLDFNTDNHYLILYDAPGMGLLCFVRLFNTFSVGFLMSKKTQNIHESFLIGKNDIEQKSFQVKRISEIMGELYSKRECSYMYWFPDQAAADEFFAAERHPDFAFYMEGGRQPVFDALGNVIYEDIGEKLRQPQLVQHPIGEITEELTTEYELDEPLFIKILPSEKLYQVVRVMERRIRTSRF